MSAKPILLSGGGLSSLLLARSLRSHSIPFLIFERDASFDIRGQGYRLRLSAEGIDAVEAVLDAEGFAKFDAVCSKTGGAGFMTMNAISGEKVEPKAQQPLSSRGGKVVGIARGDLRKTLMEGLEDRIQWGKQVTGYELLADGVRAKFADGSESEEGSMLIGGDGVRSAIAQQLSQGKLKVYDTGSNLIHGSAPSSAFKAFGEGVFALHDEETHPGGKVFLITNVRPSDMNNPDVELGWTMGGSPGVIVPPNDDLAIIGKPAADLAKFLTSKWHPKFRPLFEQMNEKEAGFWKVTCSSPVAIPEWENESRVTVIGDAVHSMTPAGGIGANTAMRDSALLGRLIGEAGGYKEAVTKEYEEKMRVYGLEAVQTSYETARKMMGINDLTVV